MSSVNIKGTYEHYKGNHYEVLGVGLDTEDCKPFVIYRPLYETDVEFWIRPLEMFQENIEINGKIVPRFRKISS